MSVSRELVYYGDLEQTSITEEQYMSNMIYRYPQFDSILSIKEIECLSDYLQVPYDIRIVFCQVTKDLPVDIQRVIFELSVV